MLYRMCLIVLFCFVLAGSSVAQTKRKATKPQKPISQPAEVATTVPVLPLEFRMGYHRNEKAIFLSIKNLDKKRSIKMVEATIAIFDSIKIEIIRQLYAVEFNFAIPIAPNAPGISVITESDLLRIGWTDHISNRCRNYIAKPDDNIFMPIACTGDVFTVVLESITFTDDSKWIKKPPEKK